jgi:hypothetical protein
MTADPRGYSSADSTSARLLRTLLTRPRFGRSFCIVLSVVRFGPTFTYPRQAMRYRAIRGRRLARGGGPVLPKANPLGRERNMARKTISSTDLIWIFHEKLEAFDDCPEGACIAIVPAFDVGWMAVMSAKSRTQSPICARRAEAIQKELREIYVLAKD